MTDAATTTALVCPNCGAAAVAGDRFCEACGADLPFTEPAPVATGDVEPVGPPCVSCGAPFTQIVDGYCGVCGMKQPAARDHTEMSDVGVAAVSDRGRKHHRNEDAFALRREDGGRLAAVVCDGVSTTVNPDLASQAAADAALAVLVDGGDLPTAAAAAQAAVEGVEGAPQPPDLGWPSCTLLAALVDGTTVDLATMGDCRTYWLPAEGPPTLVTEDDSWAAEQVASGAMTPEEAMAAPLAHTITRWLGHDADPAWTPRLARLDITGPGRLILCSDGLWNYAAAADELAAAAAAAAAANDTAGEGGEPLTVARRLVDFANEHGGHDNITVIVVDVKGPST